MSGKWDLNPQPRVWGTRYLPIDILPRLRFKAGFVNRLYYHVIYINEGFVRFPVSPPPRNVTTRVILICPFSYSPGNLFNRPSILRAISVVATLICCYRRATTNCQHCLFFEGSLITLSSYVLMRELFRYLLWAVRDSNSRII